ncbi:MAG: hypothetical protein KDE22_17265 [Rhodobacterales bacterium]|nr:hypothetical protein [Rhodobacterales bacterium]
MSGGQTPQLIYWLLLLVLLGGSVILHMRSRPGQAMRYAAIWIAVGAVVFALYKLFGPG